MKQTQYAVIFAYLKLRGRATIGDLNEVAQTNWAHKRISEMTDPDGWVIMSGGKGLYHTGHRILRETLDSGGRKIRLYRMVRG